MENWTGDPYPRPNSAPPQEWITWRRVPTSSRYWPRSGHRYSESNRSVSKTTSSSLAGIHFTDSTSLASRAKAAFDVPLTPRDVLTARTVSALAELVEEKILSELERVAVSAAQHEDGSAAAD